MFIVLLCGLPGSGKTISLFYLVRDLAGHVGMQNILYVTYTSRLKRAAREFLSAQGPGFEQSVRVRLSREEAQALCDGQTISTTLRLNTIDRFEVALQTWHLTIGEVITEASSLVISIPMAAASKLAKENDYIFSCQQPSDSSSPLVMSVEIDLQKIPNT
jgi:hypothetical protein